MTSARDNILAATVELLQRGIDPNTLTVRTIAEKAAVGVGLINYHFGNKDNLVVEAIWAIVGDVAARWYQPAEHSGVDPTIRLRQLFKETTRIVLEHRRLTEISLRHTLMEGDMTVPTLILPLLREIVGEKKSELELRLLAFQLIASTQLAFLRADALHQFLGMDILNERNLDDVLDAMITNLIGDNA